jgi:hypothetical protein
MMFSACSSMQPHNGGTRDVEMMHQPITCELEGQLDWGLSVSLQWAAFTPNLLRLVQVLTALLVL